MADEECAAAFVQSHIALVLPEHILGALVGVVKCLSVANAAIELSTSFEGVKRVEQAGQHGSRNERGPHSLHKAANRAIQAVDASFVGSPLHHVVNWHL